MTAPQQACCPEAPSPHTAPNSIQVSPTWRHHGHPNQGAGQPLSTRITLQQILCRCVTRVERVSACQCAYDIHTACTCRPVCVQSPTEGHTTPHRPQNVTGNTRIYVVQQRRQQQGLLLSYRSKAFRPPHTEASGSPTKTLSTLRRNSQTQARTQMICRQNLFGPAQRSPYNVTGQAAAGGPAIHGRAPCAPSTPACD